MKIALYRNNTLINKLIRFFSRGKFNHASVEMDDGTVIEAAFTGVRQVKSLRDKRPRGTIIDVYDVRMTLKQKKIAIDFLLKQVGKPYDIWAIFGFVFYQSHEGRKSYGKWFCSELVFAAFTKALVPLLERADAWKVSPVILSYSPLLHFSERIVVE
jgi:uncharacterized protein YycO